MTRYPDPLNFIDQALGSYSEIIDPREAKQRLIQQSMPIYTPEELLTSLGIVFHGDLSYEALCCFDVYPSRDLAARNRLDYHIRCDPSDFELKHDLQGLVEDITETVLIPTPQPGRHGRLIYRCRYISEPNLETLIKTYRYHS